MFKRLSREAAFLKTRTVLRTHHAHDVSAPCTAGVHWCDAAWLPCREELVWRAAGECFKGLKQGGSLKCQALELTQPHTSFLTPRTEVGEPCSICLESLCFQFCIQELTFPCQVPAKLPTSTPFSVIHSCRGYDLALGKIDTCAFQHRRRCLTQLHSPVRHIAQAV